MQKLQNDTLQRFLDYFIEELKRTNEDRKLYDIKEFDIPFIISSLTFMMLSASPPVLCAIGKVP